ncbi:MAG: WhiB family transcriptional regulator, redox-sensing transcriptional regulator [Pseudonocardiales bacterium]|nr:WhiB family transcriptional regulator, redox-sensing transcriptional regulator [Pseudonocardiales bacterium]
MTTTIFDRDGYHDQGALSCLGTTLLLAVRAISAPVALDSRAPTVAASPPCPGRPGDQVKRGDFRQFAACRNADPELFFPIGDGRLARRQIAAAKAVCGRCSVAADCLVWALRTGQSEGVWGGHTPSERRRLHSRRVIAGIGRSGSI